MTDDLRDRLEGYLDQRGNDLDRAGGETPFERQRRLSQTFADAIGPQLQHLQPLADPSTNPPGGSAADLLAAITADTQKETRP